MSINHRISKSKARACELLDEMQAMFTRALSRAGVREDRAAREALTMRQELCDLIGGHNVYFPQDMTSRIKQRNAEIMAEFDGKNHGDLARRYRLSENQIRVITRNAIREIQAAASLK